jgi:ribosome maturation protein Sdo1
LQIFLSFPRSALAGHTCGKEQVMDVVHERAAGIDISKRDAKVAVRVPGTRSGSYTTTVKTFGATMAQVLVAVSIRLGPGGTV